MPTPRNGAYLSLKDEIVLSWLPSRNAKLFLVYLGEVPKYTFVRKPSLDFICRQTNSTFKLEKLDSNTTYYWRVDEIIKKYTSWTPLAFHYSLKVI